MSPLDVYQAVRHGGKWDYKQRQKGNRDYQDFGNFNYGAVMTANGWGPETILRGAGWAQQRAGTSRKEFGSPLGGPPYGDDPADQRQIKAGIDYYEKTCMASPRRR